MRSFASDNNSGAHPDILEALVEANVDHCVGYGDDPWTHAAQEAFQAKFGPDSQSFFVFLGTGANVLALKAMLRPWESVLCAPTAHLNVDECGAPENVVGCKVESLPVANTLGKLTVDDLRPGLHDVGFEHHSQPRVVTVTQCTELGTVYSLEELEELSAFVHEHGMYLHMDGARLANAVVSLGLDPADGLARITRGVDVLSFGGTKNGMLYGEAVVFLNPELAKDFKYIRKQGMQLASKMRYISAQFSALFRNDLWYLNARHANSMALLLGEALQGLGVELTRPVATNAVFARLDPEVTRKLQEEYFFYVWDPERDEVRLMASFDTREEDVTSFAAALKRLL